MSRCKSVMAILAMILYGACHSPDGQALETGPALRPGPAAGRTYALLVGVSEYPALPPDLQLHGGPRNDVLLFRDYLRAHGVASTDMTVLTEGGGDGTALPTRSAILENLSHLAERVHEGDFVVLEFAGHGSQQPSKDPARIEPDGLDEIFLPRDVGHWDGIPGTVQNAITDNELGAAISQIRAHGGFVWAVFDTCHSATMTRTLPAPGEQDREVTPAQLGIPAKLMESARHQGTAPARVAARSASGSSNGRSPTNSPGGYVAFYSAQRDEAAPQRLLPAQSSQHELHGLFTFALLQSLSTQSNVSYRQVMERVLQEYQGWGVAQTTPGYEGTTLDAPVLGMTNRNPVTQWSLRTQAGQLSIAAGELQRVTSDSILAVVPDATSATPLGYVKVVRPGLTEATVVPTAYAGTPPFKPDPHLVAYVRPVDLRVDFTLHVGLPTAASFCESPGETVKAAIATLRADRELAQRIVWVGPEAVADVRLCKKANRLLFLDGRGALPSGSHEHINGLDLRRSDASPTPGSSVSPFEAALIDSLQRISRVINLYRVAAAMPATNLAVDVVLDYCQGPAKTTFDQCHPTTLTATPGHVFHAGDRIRVRLTDTSLQPVDVTVLHIDASYAITALFPDPNEPQEHARLPPRSKPVDFQIKLNASPPGAERLLVIAVPAQPESEEVSFASLAQVGLPLLGTRGASTGLAQLLNEATYGSNIRGTLKSVDATTAAIATYSWIVKP